MTTSRPLDAPDASAIRHGSKIGKFVVSGELGSGGMGVVYAAHDRELDRQVALKVMRGAGDLEAEEDRLRMLREGQAMARVVHPNVITVFEVGTERGMVFLAQELLDGGTLGQWLATPRTEPEIIEKFVAAGRGLAAAHAAGLVHRDFKPDNVLLGKDGRVRVSDFGLARAVGSFADAAAMMATAPGGGPHTDVDTAVMRSPMNNLTRTGAVMGTPMFMAPEQHEGRRADERSDQFAFCVALYHALYGDWPFDGKTSVALADNVINGVMKPPPKSAKVSPRLRKLLLRGLSTNADARYPSMDALLAELVAPPPRTGKKLAIAIAALVLAGGGGAAAYVALGTNEPAKPPPPVEDTPKPVVVANDEFDPSVLVRAVDEGSLDLAEKVFRADASPAAQASTAFILALRGDLPAAEAKLKEAEAVADADAKGKAYADLAASAIAYARGELPSAAERSARCASALSTLDARGSALCLHIQGDTAAQMDDVARARNAYNSVSVIAQQLRDKQIESMFALAVAQLDFDDKHDDVVLAPVLELQKAAHRRGAPSCEASAAVLASQILLSKAKQVEALDVFDDVDLKRLRNYRLQLMARIALAEIYGIRNEADEDGVMGLDKLDDVRDEAAKQQFWGVYLEAKLARVRVMVTLGQEDAEAERKHLIGEATQRGYARIARLAQDYNANLESPPPPQ